MRAAIAYVYSQQLVDWQRVSRPVAFVLARLRPVADDLTDQAWALPMRLREGQCPEVECGPRWRRHHQLHIRPLAEFAAGHQANDGAISPAEDLVTRTCRM